MILSKQKTLGQRVIPAFEFDMKMKRPYHRACMNQLQMSQNWVSCGIVFNGCGNLAIRRA